MLILNVYIEDGVIILIDKNWIKLNRTCYTNTGSKTLTNSTYAITALESKLKDTYTDGMPNSLGCEPIYYNDKDNNFKVGWKVNYDGLSNVISSENGEIQ